MKNVLIGGGILAVLVGVLYLIFPVQLTIFGGMIRTAILGADEPAGTTQTTTNPDYKSPEAGAGAAPHPINPDFARLNLERLARGPASVRFAIPSSAVSTSKPSR
jgi:hypothetical protein